MKITHLYNIQYKNVSTEDLCPKGIKKRRFKRDFDVFFCVLIEDNVFATI
jgi:hypothetical protein